MTARLQSRFAVSFFLAMTTAVSASAAEAMDTPRVARSTIATVEKNLDSRFTRLWDDNPVAVLGPTRGVYLEGYGLVFTTEVNLVAGPALTLFNTSVSPEYIARHKRTKLARIPDLKKELQKALADAAVSKELAAVPPGEQIVLIALLSHFPWEDLKGMPVEIRMQGVKSKLIEAKSAGGATLEAAIQAAQF